VRRGEAIGCACGRCGREVSAPFGYERSLVWCLYCGIDAGHVPGIETPWGHRWSFGVTREECAEDKEALERGGWDAMAEARARREGRVIDLF
ncbi:MAG TPA: hypothetical protein VFS39_04185, partial [Nitrospira sp.]|nr:hypothetical protein [Nitrospira sp.]